MNSLACHSPGSRAFHRLAWLLSLALILPLAAQTPQTPAGTAAQPAASPLEGLAAQLGSSALTEDSLGHALVGKTFYLRGGYLENTLAFDMQGKLDGNSARGSFTLALVEINKVSLRKKRLELTAIRYGLHFMGALPGEDAAATSDRVRITPKKKSVRILVEREPVMKPKKQKAPREARKDANPRAESATDENGSGKEPAAGADTPTAEQEAGKANSQAQADQLLRSALDSILAPEIDARMKSEMPDYWQGYFNAASSPHGVAQTAEAIPLQASVDQKAQLAAPIEPSSNEFAQSGGIAGMALYRAVVAADGKATQVVVTRPIGFGLDENAVDSIRQAKFRPASIGGKATPVWVDVVVQFRIYSKRTAASAPAANEAQAAEKALPGPYSVQRPATQ